MFSVTTTQHRGKQQRGQQDALFDGTRTIQSLNYPVRCNVHHASELLIAVADGVSVSPYPNLASRYWMDMLAPTQHGHSFDARLLRQIHSQMCKKMARGNTYGSSTTLVAASIKNNLCTILNVGDSRAYHINTQGDWQQLSHDHTVLNEFIASGQAQSGEDYADIYSGLAHCLVADEEAFDFAIARAEKTLAVGDCILLCSDGVHDVLSAEFLQQSFTAHSPRECVAHWRKHILHMGAPDNFSIVLAQLNSLA